MVDLEKLKDLLDDWSVGEVREILAYADSDKGFLDYLKEEYDIDPEEDWEDDEDCFDDEDDSEDDYEDDDDEDECEEVETPSLTDEEKALADGIIDDIDNGRYSISVIENVYPNHIVSYIKDYVD